MSGRDSAETVIAANGSVWLADITDTTPTDATTALGSVDADWLELGFVSADGVNLEVSADQNMLEAWNNGGFPVRRYVTSRGCKVSFSLEQVNALNIPFAFGGGEVTGGGVNEVVNVVLTGFDGGTADSFKITFGGSESALIGFGGVTYTAAHIKTAFDGISGVTEGVIVSAVTNGGFTLEFTGNYAQTNVGAVTITTTTGCSGVATVATSGSASGGSAWVYTPPENDDAVPVKALVVDWADGDKNYRLLIPMGSVTNAPSTSLTRTDAMMLPIEFEATPDGTTDAYRIYTDDSAFSGV